jgi:hypothetical protein
LRFFFLQLLYCLYRVLSILKLCVDLFYQLELLVNELFSRFAAYSFYTAYTSCHRGLAGDLKESKLACSAYVCTTAELY